MKVHTPGMAHRFKTVDRNTPMFLPPDLRDWVAEDDLVHLVIQAVERLPLCTFAVNHKGCAPGKLPPTSRAWTGRCGSPQWARCSNIPGHFIWSGSYCTTILER